MNSRLSSPLALLYLLSFFLSLAFAQFASPTNVTTYNATSAKNTVYLVYPDSFHYHIQPLIPAALSALSSGDIKSGSPYNVQPGVPNKFSNASIVYLSCDSFTYSQGQINQQQVLQEALSASPKAIIFYSTSKKYCNFTSSPLPTKYTSLYSTISPTQATKLSKSLSGHPPIDQWRIMTRFTYNAKLGNSAPGPYGDTPSTAVAMIILYTITGVITALFIVIIVSGAVKAHRHPERYGPRHGAGYGNPPQGRARGLARAVLDTIPIVQFGGRPNPATPDPEDPKPNDMELQNRAPTADREPSSQVQGNDAGVAQVGATADVQHEQNKVTTVANESSEHNTTPETNVQDTPAEQTVDSTDAAVAQADDQGFHCSICVEEFEQGQDIRVLPCNHHFHPRCVDPWLLDVSGTCPLCRVDLRPADQRGSSSNPNDLAPPLDRDSFDGWFSLRGIDGSRSVETGPNPLMQLILGNRVNTSTREERVEALRSFRFNHRRRSQLRNEPTPGPATEEAERQRMQSLQEEEERNRRRWDRVRQRFHFHDRVR